MILLSCSRTLTLSPKKVCSIVLLSPSILFAHLQAAAKELDAAEVQYGFYITCPIKAKQGRSLKFHWTRFTFRVERKLSLPFDSRLKSEPLLWKFIPEWTRFQPTALSGINEEEILTFMGYTIDSKLLARNDEGTTYAFSGFHEALIHVHPETRLEVSGVYFSGLLEHLLRKDTLRHAYLGSRGTYYPAAAVEEIQADETARKVHKLLLRRLRNARVRGVPLYDLVEHLFSANGYSHSLVVTGGAIRDLLCGNEPSDIDLAICDLYQPLQRVIQDYITLRGESLSSTSFRHAGSMMDFGQLKVIVRQEEYKELEDLDIALFKAAKYPQSEITSVYEAERSKKAEIKANQYVYGWSYAADSKQRDFTLNALYLEVFGNPPYLLDPSGRGIVDSKKNRLFPVSPHAFVFSDLGGNFRLHRLLDEEYVSSFDVLDLASLGILLEIQKMSDDWDSFKTSESEPELTTRIKKEYRDMIDRARGFFRKLQKKLLKKTLDPDDALRKMEKNYKNLLVKLEALLCKVSQIND